MQLTLPGGQIMDVVRWSVSPANGAAVRSGSVDVTNRQSVSLVIGNLPAGSALRIDLSGSADDGGVSCAGSASFDIEEGRTTPVPVLLACNPAVVRAAPATPLWAAWAFALVLACIGTLAARRRRGPSPVMGSGTLAFLAVTTAQATGCSSDDAVQAPNESAEATGSLEMALTLPDGTSLDTIHWTITGPNGATAIAQAGSVNVRNSTSLRIVVAQLAGGSYYDVALSGTSTNGATTCTGADSFSVSARTTTNITVVLDCSSAPREAGALAISAETYACAVVRSFSISPSEAVVGASVSLSASAAGVDPGSLTYVWSAPSGSFASPNASATAFTCTKRGIVPITLRVSDGPVPDGGACDEAASTLILLVTCTAPADGGAS
jgi:hypothetical protein